MIRSVLFASALLCLASLASAHICMWAPMQRGAFSIDNPGANMCAHKGPDPCGQVASGSPLTSIPAGSTYTALFQQNLNHWYGGNPGHLEIQIAKGPNPSESDFNYVFGVSIPDWNAMDEVTMTNFTITGVIPSTPCDHCVMRLVYSSNNPLENDTSTNFFQCADITITSSAASSLFQQEEDQLVKKPVAPHTPKATGDCIAPQSFEASLLVASKFAPLTGLGSVSYDSSRQLMYAYMPTQGSTSTIHYSNFSSGIEWLYNQVDNSCSAYGLDQWSNWDFGSTENESFEDTVTIDSTPVNVFENALADITFGAGLLPSDPSSCVPLFRYRTSNQEIDLYMNQTLGIADPTIFIPPAVCKMHHAYALTQQPKTDAAAQQELKRIVATLPRSSSRSSSTSYCKRGVIRTPGKQQPPKIDAAQSEQIQQTLVQIEQTLQQLQQRKQHKKQH